MNKQTKKKISIIGAGRVGTSLGTLLAQGKFPFVGILSRSEVSSIKAMKLIRKGQVFSSLKNLLQKSDVVLIAVNDEQIKNIVKKISKMNRCERKIFIHTSGLLTSAVLSPLSKRGAHVASMHPLLTIPSSKIGSKLMKGTYFALEGDEKALLVAEELVRLFGGKSFLLSSKLKSRYHLAACLLSNYIVALSDLAMDLLANKARTRNQWLALFAPLIKATALSLGKEGLPGALTGPISRGDLSTLKKHQHILEKSPKNLQIVHRILTQRALAIALAQDKLEDVKKKKLIELLNA